jgi:N-acetylglucosaminyldiphosphoundecaprenol N-acetyl-beta-D-mannosaminyltransferase
MAPRSVHIKDWFTWDRCPRPGPAAMDKPGRLGHIAGPKDAGVRDVPERVIPQGGLLTGAAALALVNQATEAGLLAELDAALAQGRGFAVATLNLDHLVKMARHPGFAAAYRAQTHVVADGNPVVWLRALMRRPVDLVPGSELITPLAALAARRGVPVALYGSDQATLDLAADRLVAAHPGLQVVARIAPAFGFDPMGDAAAADLARLADAGARLVFLALGAPKQEILAARGRSLQPDLGFVSIGAGLDFIAGAQVRAPLWVRRIAMEWAWRMGGQPRRLARRYWDCARILPGLALAAWAARPKA